MEQSEKNTLHEQMLKSLIESFEFNKMNYVPLILPSIFLFISMMLISYGLGQTLKFLGSKLEEDVSLNVLLGSQMLQWGIISLLGFTIATMIASYYVLENTRKHIYESSVTTYYFKGGSTAEGLIQYLRSIYARASLPAPVTGLLLSFLTSGLSYLVVLYIVEKTIREHAILEENTLLESRVTGKYGLISFIIDLVLLFLTMGIYLAYMGYRLGKVYNKHVELIHGNHPLPPSKKPDVNVSKEFPGDLFGEKSTTILISLLLVGIALNIMLCYFGFYSILTYVPSYGLIIGAITVSRRNTSSMRDFLLTLCLIYTLIIGSMLTGLLAHDTFSYIARSFQKQVEEVGVGRDPWFTARYIFTNNLLISLPAIIPYIGGLLIGYGVTNAGLLIGAIVGAGLRNLLEGLLILVYPHSLLELSAYSILITSSKYLFSNTRKFLIHTITGILVLFLAALVEALTIVLLR
ncbi:MAG: stage II sporulation protein M [Desulfurococcaceae archaeon]